LHRYPTPNAHFHPLATLAIQRRRAWRRCRLEGAATESRAAPQVAPLLRAKHCATCHYTQHRRRQSKSLESTLWPHAPCSRQATEQPCLENSQPDLLCPATAARHFAQVADQTRVRTSGLPFSDR